MTDRDRETAREIADKIRCTPSCVDRDERLAMWEGLIAAAIRARGG